MGCWGLGQTFPAVGFLPPPPLWGAPGLRAPGQEGGVLAHGGRGVPRVQPPEHHDGARGPGGGGRGAAEGGGTSGFAETAFDHSSSAFEGRAAGGDSQGGRGLWGTGFGHSGTASDVFSDGSHTHNRHNRRPVALTPALPRPLFIPFPSFENLRGVIRDVHLVQDSS